MESAVFRKPFVRAQFLAVLAGRATSLSRLQVSFELPPRLMHRFQDYRHSMETTHPEEDIGPADVVRRLVIVALNQAQRRRRSRSRRNAT